MDAPFNLLVPRSRDCAPCKSPLVKYLMLMAVLSPRGSHRERPMSKEHPAAYAMELKRSWRVVVPVRGKLTPRICREKFTCRAEALTWMNTAEGHQAIASVR